MLNKERDLKGLNLLLGSWIAEIRLDKAVNYLDINKVSEGFSLKLLNLLFNYELEDLNKVVTNYEGLDLGNFNTSKVAFQVTSRVDTDKVISSLKTITGNNDHLKFTGGIKFLILREGEKIKFPKKGSDPKTHLPAFDKDRDILYPENLTKKISDIYDSDDFTTFLKIKKLIEREIQLVRRDLLDNAEKSLSEVKDLLEQTMRSLTGVQQGKQTFGYDNFLTADFPELAVRSPRKELADSYVKTLSQQPVFWLCGVSGTGKSSMAYLIGQRFSQQRCWIDFRDIPLAELPAHLFNSLNNTLGIAAGPAAANLSAIIAAMGDDGIIILNDLPDVSQTAKANNLIMELAKHAVKNNVRVVVTSNYPASLTFKSQFSAELFPADIPLFTDEETGDVLTAFGAPEAVVEQYRKSVNILSEGYPVIINSIANYLKDKNWVIDTEVINNIFKNDYNDQLNHEVYGSVVASTEDEDTLNLLYRCRAVIGNFGTEELEVIAAVEPAIPFASQKFEKIKGIWVQRTKQQKYQLSPLIKRLHSNLPAQLEQAISNALGEALVKKKTLNQVEIAKSIQYFIKGEALMDAAMMLVAVLRQSVEHPKIFFEWGFNLYWFYTEIPKAVNVPTRLFIRFLQVNICIAAEEDYNYLIADIRHILATEEVDPRAAGLTQMLFYQLESKSDPISAMNHLVEAYKNLPLREMFNSDDEAGNELKFENSIWLSFCGCKTDQDFSSWFAQIKDIKFRKGVPDPGTNQAYVAAGLSLYVNLIAEKNISDLPVAQPLLIKIIRLALEAKFHLIAAYALRNLVIIFCADLKLYAAAESLVATYVPLMELHPVYKFLIYDELGRQLFSAGDSEKGAFYLDQVIDTELPDFFAERVTAYRMYAQLKGVEQPELAHTYAMKALDFVEQHNFFLPLEKIKIYGEAGISYWLAGEAEQAVAIFEKGYDLLNKVFDNSPDQQAQVIRYGSVANYIAHQMMTGKVLKETADGTYAIPQRGSFYFSNDKIHESGMYNTERRYMGAHLFQVAYEFLSNYETARKWALNCIQIMLEVEDPRFAVLLHGSLFYLINDRAYGKALNVANYIKNHYKPQPIRKGNNTADQQIEDISRKIVQDDTVFYNFLFIPVLFKVVPDVLDGSIPTENYDRLIHDLFEHPELALAQPDAFRFAKDIFIRMLYTGIDPLTLHEMFEGYAGEYTTELKVIAYLMAGIHSTAKEAANFQVSMVTRFQSLYVENFSEIVTLLIVPFFENFWLSKAKINANEFYDFGIWEKESVPKFREDEGMRRTRKLFQTLNYHLDLELPDTIRQWIKSK